jgi:membrane associated rhomboid family serine protease
MLPLKDDLPNRTFPVVTVGLIVLNVLAYLYQYSLELSSHPVPPRVAESLNCVRLDPRLAASNPGLAFVCELGAIPCRLADRCLSPDAFPHPLVTVFTSMFLHGGPLHLGGNMLYLWIFGNNVEDTLGHARFLFFYLLSGMAAAAAQTVTNLDSVVPMVGASGAISGVLGAYLLLFPHATVLTLITFGFFIRFVHVPAIVVLGFWIVVQFVQGYLSYRLGGEGGGVAWFAHVGGFLAGMLLLFLLRPRRGARL